MIHVTFIDIKCIRFVRNMPITMIKTQTANETYKNRTNELSIGGMGLVVAAPKQSAFEFL